MYKYTVKNVCTNIISNFYKKKKVLISLNLKLFSNL